MADDFAGLVFEEAADYLRRRLELEPDVYLDLVKQVDAAATDRAAGMRDAMVKDLLEAVLKAIEEGSTVETFRDEFDQIAKANGWEGDNEDGWRSVLTFRTTMAQAMAAGRWTQIQRLKARRPWLRYVTAGDERVRDAHAGWHGIILSADDPWWKTHFPPNGFNCRCHVQQLSDRDLVRYGLEVTPEAPDDRMVATFMRGPDGLKKPVKSPRGIDPGFAYNVGEIGLGLAP